MEPTERACGDDDDILWGRHLQIYTDSDDRWHLDDGDDDVGKVTQSNRSFFYTFWCPSTWGVVWVASCSFLPLPVF